MSESIAMLSASDTVQNDSISSESRSHIFPEVAFKPLRVLANLGPHRKETEIEIGCTRLRVLMPFAFPHLATREDEELWEFAAPLDDKGTMLSMLWVPSRC